MKKIYFVFSMIVFCISSYATVDIETAIGGSVYHDGVFECVTSQRFIVSNDVDFSSASKENPIIVKVYSEDAVVLACDIDKINDENDGVNWVEIETDGTEYGWSQGEVKIRGGKNWNYLEIRIEKAPGNNGFKPDDEHNAWFDYGSTITFTGKVESRKCYSESAPDNVIREFISGIRLFYDFSGRVEGEDAFKENDVTALHLQTFQGESELNTEYLPSNPPLAYGSDESLFTYVSNIWSKEGGKIEYDQILLSKVSVNIIPETGYFTDKVTINGESVEIKDYYEFSGKRGYNVYAIFKPYNISFVSLTSNFESGNIPVDITYNIEATPKEGFDIVSYNWDFDGDGDFELSTDSTTVTAHYTVAGKYTPKVTIIDSTGEKTTFSHKQIIITSPSSIAIPNSYSEAQAKSQNTVSTVAINPFSDTLTITLNGFDNTGQVVTTANQVIQPFGKDEIAISSVFTDGVSYVLAEPDRYAILYTNWEKENAYMSAYLSSTLFSTLYIPHIAEEIDQWQSKCFISAYETTETSIFAGGNTHSLNLESSNVVNLENYIDISQPDKSWGKVTCNESKLCGFEMFIKNGGDGAAMEMTENAYSILYIPHIPVEEDVFWTGFAFVNPTSSLFATLNAKFYTEEGLLCHEQELTIPAGAKLKGIVRELFPELPVNACWGTITSSLPIVGAELYGTHDAGICGFSLNGNTFEKGILPIVIAGENLWTGVSFVNVENRVATVTLTLYNKEGIAKENFDFSLNPNQKASATVTDIFPDAEIFNTDYIKFSSNRKLIAVEAGGDEARTWMKALPAVN